MMPIHEGKYYLSNSEMNSWESGMCPKVWKALYIDKDIDSSSSEAMVYGSWFETVAIGCGVGGKVTEPTPEMLRSVFADRVNKQAADCRRYLKALGGKIISRQEYIYTSIKDDNGQEIMICGGLDVRYGFPGTDRPNMIIDLKFTGKTDNDFGPYQWGNIDKVNPQQLVHYAILHEQKYGTLPDTEFWVFDKSPAMDQKFVGVQISEVGKALHVEKCSRVYNEITMAMGFDDWGYKNTFANCRSCPVKCEYERVIPEVQYITA